MSQEDYQKKIDEHRQSIGVEEDSMESRRSRRKTTKKPKKKSKLLPSLFFIFILIPICILIYVQFFLPDEVEKVEEQQIIQVETKNITNNKEEEKEHPNAKEEDPKDTAEENHVTTVPKTEEKEEPKAETPKEEPKTEDSVQKKTHQVQEGETLYRIAMNYYKNPDAVEKIKAANGLRSNDISAGQKLILP